MLTKILRFTILGLSIVAFTQFAFASSSIGTSKDPFVSKSYVDSKMGTVSAKDKAAITSAVNSKISKYTPQYKKFKLKKGQTLYLSNGAELVPLSQKWKLNSSTDYMINTTKGTTLKAGYGMTSNNSYISRKPNTKVYVTSDSWAFVKGYYVIR